ncbi:MICOS complex subunit MIC27 [Danio aesculapii]|uniref:MICOS complex subunit MIC27 n=1 Tax=Danio aesculapii TaxID=1142201 RepID=UPI0024C0CDEC|nr:MICOS complex subunit MIC27 [Danio aesculapii]
MAAKILKYAAIPAAAVVGLGSFRIYSLNEKTNEELISPRELSIYSPDGRAVLFVEEQPGLVQTGLGSVRVGLQPYVRAVQSGLTSVKVGVISLYQAGQDTYHFLRDPPPGFLPRVTIIGVSGLGGLILARKSSRLKRIVVPLGLASAGTAVCYPTQTVGALKITGKKVYTVSSSVASMLKSKPKEDVVKSAVNVESTAAVKSPDTESPTKALSELPPEFDAAPATPEQDVTPVPDVVPSVELSPTADVPDPPPVVDVASGTSAPLSEPEPTPAPALEAVPVTEAAPVPVEDTVPDAESTPEPSPEPIADKVKESTIEPLEAPAADTDPEPTPSSETDVTSVVESDPKMVPELEVPVLKAVEITTTVEEATPPAPVLPDDFTPTILDEGPAFVDPPPAEEAIPLTPPPAEANQPIADKAPPSEPATVKSRFAPDPSLLDHGQSNPEDADMYSTRS